MAPSRWHAVQHVTSIVGDHRIRERDQTYMNGDSVDRPITLLKEEVGERVFVRLLTCYEKAGGHHIRFCIQRKEQSTHVRRQYWTAQ